jgi:hypothetical protein
MNELFSTLTWPGAFAIVGSVLTVVLGFLGLFATYHKASSNGKTKSQLPSPENLQIHQRISTLRDRVGTVEAQLLVLNTRIENLVRQCSDHDARDVDDFKTINGKVDKLMEIIVEMLKGDQ